MACLSLAELVHAFRAKKVLCSILSCKVSLGEYLLGEAGEVGEGGEVGGQARGRVRGELEQACPCPQHETTAHDQTLQKTSISDQIRSHIDPPQPSVRNI